jgi:hypothetical protein
MNAAPSFSGGGRVTGGPAFSGGPARSGPGPALGGRPSGNFAFRGDHHRDRFRGLYAFGGPVVAPDYYDSDDAYVADDSSCWQRQLVPTQYGLRWQLVDVCE